MTPPQSRRCFLAGASLVLPDRVVSGQTLVIEGNRIVDFVSGPRETGPDEVRVNLEGHFVVPGFIDVHVHGVAGTDTLDAGGAAVRTIAEQLPRFGVAAFCPTSVACPPAELDRFLEEVGRLRQTSAPQSRVLPAHIESNFINPEFRGAQPVECLRVPSGTSPNAASSGSASAGDAPQDFTARDILDVIDRRRADLAIVTLAPEIPGGLELTRALVAGGLRVSLGHSGATFEQAQEAIAAGARQATHLFNRMRPMTHRDPGLVGAALASEDLAVEIICDGLHVHPAVMRLAVAAKGPSRTLAITDGTAGSGLPPGSKAKIGGRPITVSDIARLDDGTMAGSVLTMDRAFAGLITKCGFDLVQAAEMCATTPARELGLVGHGVIAPGAIADVTVLDSRLQVVQTWVGGVRIWPPTSGFVS
ncbi:MAG TPA: N-acetylglucosamine-6-phosphate deacetylase [Vicinamibacterales bacterium]|nr:N-acetylglucosamine-6-phosphate deacetylase [Vicinamibacterales bacterium]